MASTKIITAQRDFSAGQLDVAAKRSDDTPTYKAGARQLTNWRILNSRGIANRPGRRVLFSDGPRSEEMLMAPGQTFHLAFGTEYVHVYNAAGQRVFDSGLTLPWSAATVNEIVIAQYRLSIYLFFPGQRPRVLTWDGISQTSAWSVAPYFEDVIGNQKRTIFYRISPFGVTLLPSARSGSVSLTFSAGMNLTPGHVSTRLRFVNKQILITAVSGPTTATGLVEETLYAGFSLNAGGGSPPDLTQYFGVGDVVIGQLSGAKGIVTGFSGVGNQNVLVQGLLSTSFGAVGNEVVVGPNGSVGITIVAGGNPFAAAVWDDEVMNNMRGFPAAGFVDQGRLGMCNFPDVPGMVAWSAITAFGDLYTDSANVEPDNAITEIVPTKSQVLYVVPGMESSEFVFCDNVIYYIPITPTNPLKPGSVSFNQISSDGAAAVHPRNAQQTIIYIGSGGTRVKAVQAPGAYNRPYVVDDISTLHSELINDPIAIAVQGAADQYEEQYIFVLNSDGSMAVGKYEIKSGLIQGAVGWVPWDGSGAVTWVASFGLDIIFTGTYAPNGIAPVPIVELLDNSRYLDASVLVNNLPPSLMPTTGGLGPLWWLPNGTVTLMDQGTRMMGVYQIDGQGYIVPQNNAGEDLTRADLVAGQPWTATCEPFVPSVSPGQDVAQRITRRRVGQMVATVVDSTGFVMARLGDDGSTAGSRRFTAWNQGDNPLLPPPLREETQQWRPLGRKYDPRVAIIKDTPGPITVAELATEVSV